MLKKFCVSIDQSRINSQTAFDLAAFALMGILSGDTTAAEAPEARQELAGYGIEVTEDAV